MRLYNRAPTHVASYILWVVPSLLLLIEYSLFNPVTICLISGIFLIFSAHEIHHQIADYMGDKQTNVKTLTVKIGLKKAFLISNITSSLGFLLIAYSMYVSLHFSYFVFFAPLILLFILLQNIIATKKSIILTGNIPVKTVLIAFGVLSLGLSPLMMLLILTVFFAEIYRCVQYHTLPKISEQMTNI